MKGLSQVRAIIYSELKAFYRDKMSVFWVIVFPVLMVMISSGLWANPNPNPITVGVYVEDRSTGPFNASLIISVMEDTGLFKVKIYPSLASMVDDMRNDGRPAVGLYFPQGFAENASRGVPARLGVLKINVPELWVENRYYQVEGFLSSVKDTARKIILDVLEKYVPPQYAAFLKGLANPINETTILVSPRNSVSTPVIRGYMAVSMMVVEALFIGMSIGATLIHEAREEGVLRMVLSSAVPSWALLLGYTLVTILFVIIAGVASLAAGAVMGAQYKGVGIGTVLVTGLVVVVSTLFTLGIGLLLAPFARSSKGASGLATAIAFPLMFLGGIWIPVEFLPKPIRIFAEIFPLSKLTDMLRLMIVYGRSPINVIASMPLQIVALTVAAYALGAYMYRRMLEIMLEAG